MPIIPIIAVIAIALVLFSRRGGAPATPARPMQPRLPTPPRPTILRAAQPKPPTTPSGSCGALLDTGDCPTGTCPMDRALAASLSSIGDVVDWANCAAAAAASGQLTPEQVRKGIVGEPAVATLAAGRGWDRVLADINAVAAQHGSSAVPGNVSHQYLGPRGDVRTVALTRNPTSSNLQLVYHDALSVGWRMYPQFAAYGTAYW